MKCKYCGGWNVALAGHEENCVMRPDLLHDKGPWHTDGKLILSDDFTHDVSLALNGDFSNEEQRKAYAENLVKKLNTNVTLAVGNVIKN